MELKFPPLTSICLIVTSGVALYSACSLKSSQRYYRKTVEAINFRELRTEIRHLSDLVETRVTLS